MTIVMWRGEGQNCRIPKDLSVPAFGLAEGSAGEAPIASTRSFPGQWGGFQRWASREETGTRVKP